MAIVLGLDAKLLRGDAGATEVKNVGLHGNLWVNQCEIHQNPPSVKRQSGITAPLRVAFIPFVV